MLHFSSSSIPNRLRIQTPPLCTSQAFGVQPVLGMIRYGSIKSQSIAKKSRQLNSGYNNFMIATCQSWKLGTGWYFVTWVLIQLQWLHLSMASSGPICITMSRKTRGISQMIYNFIFYQVQQDWNRDCTAKKWCVVQIILARGDQLIKVCTCKLCYMVHSHIQLPGGYPNLGEMYIIIVNIVNE